MTRAELDVESWNITHKVGTRVLVWHGQGDVQETVTTSEAWALCRYVAVIRVRGFSGAYALNRVRALA